MNLSHVYSINLIAQRCINELYLIVQVFKHSFLFLHSNMTKAQIHTDLRFLAAKKRRCKEFYMSDIIWRL